MRIAVDLVDAQGCSVWSSRCDETMDDFLELQDSIAMQIAGQLPVWLRDAEIAETTPRSRISGVGIATVRHPSLMR